MILRVLSSEFQTVSGVGHPPTTRRQLGQPSKLYTKVSYRLWWTSTEVNIFSTRMWKSVSNIRRFQSIEAYDDSQVIPCNGQIESASIHFQSLVDVRFPWACRLWGCHINDRESQKPRLVELPRESQKPGSSARYVRHGRLWSAAPSGFGWLFGCPRECVARVGRESGMWIRPSGSSCWCSRAN